MTADVLQIAQAASRGVLTPTGVARVGDRVRWRDRSRPGGPYRVAEVGRYTLTVERPVAGRGRRVALWPVRIGAVEVVR